MTKKFLRNARTSASTSRDKYVVHQAIIVEDYVMARPALLCSNYESACQAALKLIRRTVAEHTISDDELLAKLRYEYGYYCDADKNDAAWILSIARLIDSEDAS